MAYTDQDNVDATMTGDDSVDPSDQQSRMKRFVQRLGALRNQAPSLISNAAGAGKDSSGPNGPGLSGPPSGVKSSSDVDDDADLGNIPSLGPVSAGQQQRAAENISGIAQAPAEMPQLAPQGGGNKFVRFLARLSGSAGPTPKPGDVYLGPQGPTKPGTFGGPDTRTTGQARGQGIASLLSRLGNAMMAAGGTPEQKELALSMPLQRQKMNLELAQLENENLYHRALVGERSRHDIAQEGINQQKADTQQYGIDVHAQIAKSQRDLQARYRGYVPDENDASGQSYRPMSEQEIASDPMLSQQREVKQAIIEKTRAEKSLKLAMNDPNSPIFRQRQQAYDLANQRLELAIANSQRAERHEQFVEGQATAKNAALSPAAQKILMETGPVKSQIEDLITRLEPLKENNQPAYFAKSRLQYAIGIHSDENDLAQALSEVELSRIAGAARVLKGSSRAYQVFEKALTHTPQPWKDSPQQMYSKLKTIHDNLVDIENDAYTYGSKSGAVPPNPNQPKSTTSPTTPLHPATKGNPFRKKANAAGSGPQADLRNQLDELWQEHYGPDVQG